MRIAPCLRTFCFAVLALSIIVSQAQQKRTLTIYAATSLTDAFEELTAAFLRDHPEADIVLNFASSSKLAAQLMAGAPADIFASANSAQMDLVVADGRISAEAVKILRQQSAGADRAGGQPSGNLGHRNSRQ